MIVLLCIDIAIKLHSPNSGDAKRATYNHFLDDVQHKLDINITNNRNMKMKMNTTQQEVNNDYNLNCNQMLEKLYQTITKEEIASLLSTKYNGHGFHSVHQLSRKVYSNQALIEVQKDLLKSLNFSLHPPTSTNFIHCYLEILLHSIKDWCCYSTSSSCLCEEHCNDDISSDINDFANMQVELAIFDMSLARTKPSIIAFCALQNAIIQHSCNYIESSSKATALPANDMNSSTTKNNENENMNYNQKDTTSYSSNEDKFNILTKIIQKRLRHINFAIGEKFLKLNDKEMMDVSSIQKKLLNHWKKNNPDVVTFDNSMFMKVTPSAIMIQTNKRHLFIPIGTPTKYTYVPKTVSSSFFTAIGEKESNVYHSVTHEVLDVSKAKKCAQMMYSSEHTRRNDGLSPTSVGNNRHKITSGKIEDSTYGCTKMKSSFVSIDCRACN